MVKQTIRRLKKMNLEKIRTIFFYIGIICGVIGFSIAKIYGFAVLMLALGIGMIYHDYSNKKAIELIKLKDKC